MAASIGAAQLTNLALTAVTATLNTRPNLSRGIRAGEQYRLHTDRRTPSGAADLAALTGLIRATAKVTGGCQIAEVRASDCTEGQQGEVAYKQIDRQTNDQTPEHHTVWRPLRGRAHRTTLSGDRDRLHPWATVRESTGNGNAGFPSFHAKAAERRETRAPCAASQGDRQWQ